jgi:hypothetical protein
MTRRVNVTLRMRLQVAGRAVGVVEKLATFTTPFYLCPWVNSMARGRYSKREHKRAKKKGSKG